MYQEVYQEVYQVCFPLWRLALFAFEFAGIVQLAFKLDSAYVWCHTMEPQPSNPGSAAGSPTAGGTTIDGAELARRMLLATEAASDAASQAAKALEELKTASDKGDRSWYKLLQKPGSFDPAATREQEISLWKEFRTIPQQH